MFDNSEAAKAIGAELRTNDGDKVGTIGQIYVDDYHDQPEWATVNTGLFGTSESFVPLVEAAFFDGAVTVPYAKDKIKGAPKIDDSGHLTEAEEQKLYEYYDIAYTTEGSTFAASDSAGQNTTEYAAADDRDAGRHAAESGTDGSITRSEEKLNVGTERVESGKARLRKWVETENVQVDVPVRTEKAVLVSEPITDANRGAAFSDQIGEQEQEIVLTEERPVVSKETVAKERVRLDTDVQESVQTVDGQVRKERIELDDEVDTRGGDRR